MAEREGEWQFFVENRQAVVEALERGECTGILPAARGFLDGFAGFLLKAGILEVLAVSGSPTARRRVAATCLLFT